MPGSQYVGCSFVPSRATNDRIPFHFLQHAAQKGNAILLLTQPQRHYWMSRENVCAAEHKASIYIPVYAITVCLDFGIPRLLTDNFNQYLVIFRAEQQLTAVCGRLALSTVLSRVSIPAPTLPSLQTVTMIWTCTKTHSLPYLPSIHAW